MIRPQTPARIELFFFPYFSDTSSTCFSYSSFGTPNTCLISYIINYLTHFVMTVVLIDSTIFANELLDRLLDVDLVVEPSNLGNLIYCISRNLLLFPISLSYI